MNCFVEGIRTLFLRKVGAVLDEARSLRDLAADVARYAADRRQGGKGGPGGGTDSIRAIVEQLLIEAGLRLIDVKQEVVVRIAHERRLAKVLEHETKEASAWSRLAAEAEGRGDQALGAEARHQERGHIEEARHAEAQMEQQRADNERLGDELRALYKRFEDAEQASARLAARWSAPCAQRTVQQNLRWIDEALRLFEGLAALEDRRDEEVSAENNSRPSSPEV